MANIHLKRWRFNRRQVLRGMGVSIALPMLDCMAQSSTPAQPKRSVFIYITNGVNTLTRLVT